MFRDLPIFLFLILGGAIVVSLVSQVQPLTSSGGSSSRTTDQAKYQAEYDKELKDCRARGGGTNCRCAAKISGAILADKEPRVRGAVYADKTELARGQTKNKC